MGMNPCELLRRHRGEPLRCCLCRHPIALNEGFLKVNRVRPYESAGNGVVVAYVCQSCGQGNVGDRGGSQAELIAAGGKPRGARAVV